MRRGIALLMCAFASMTFELRAAEPREPMPGAPSITLDALVADVLERNQELRFYEAELAATRGERTTAAAWENTELSGGVGRKEVRAGNLSDEGTAWAVSLKQRFPWPGRISLKKAIADRQVQLAELGLARFKAALAARARLLAYSLLAAREKSDAASDVADRFQRLRQVLVQRDPTGLTPQLEIRIIEAAELTLHRRATEAALEVEGALLEVNQLRGEAWDSRVRISPVDLTFGPAPDREALLAGAQANNFELQVRRIELEQQGFRVDLARKEGRPSIAVAPYYSEEQAGDREKQLGVGVSLALPLWDRNRGGIASAEARRQQAQTSLEVTQMDLDRRVLEAAVAYRTKTGEIARWRPEAVEEFRKAAELADRHYRLGAVPIATYVELQKQYLDAMAALLDTRREALDAAQELENLTGIAVLRAAGGAPR